MENFDKLLWHLIIIFKGIHAQIYCYYIVVMRQGAEGPSGLCTPDCQVTRHVGTTPNYLCLQCPELFGCCRSLDFVKFVRKEKIRLATRLATRLADLYHLTQSVVGGCIVWIFVLGSKNPDPSQTWCSSVELRATENVKSELLDVVLTACLKYRNVFLFLFDFVNSFANVTSQIADFPAGYRQIH